MKKIKQYILGSLAPLFVQPIQALAYDLPYIGPDKASDCQIHQPPKSLEDGGYHTDERCQVIYVKPPALGRLRFNAASKTLLAAACPSKTTLANKMFEREKNLANLSGDAYMEEEATIKSFYRSFFELQNWGATLNLSLSFDLNWQSLVEKYRQANPGKVVETLPIDISTITIYPVLGENIDHPMAKLDLSQPAYFALSALRIDPQLAQGVPEFVRSSLNVCGDADRTGGCTDSYLVGQSAAAKLSLSFPQTCVLMDKNNQFQPASAAGYIAATYTYFYKLQSKAYYQVEVDKGAMLAAISTALQSRSHGDLTVPDLAKIVGEKNAIIITENPGYTGVPIQLTEERKNELRQFATGAFLATATTKLAEALKGAHYNKAVQQQKRECSWFLGIEHDCHNRPYYINIEQINWNQINERMAELGAGSPKNPDEAKSRDQAYTQFSAFDTSTFMPDSLVQPLKSNQ